MLYRGHRTKAGKAETVCARLVLWGRQAQLMWRSAASRTHKTAHHAAVEVSRHRTCHKEPRHGAVLDGGVPVGREQDLCSTRGARET